MPNRRALLEFGEAELQCGQRYPRPFTVAMLDVDDFKAINDRYGHSAGDDLLQDLARVIRKSLRSTDFMARLGGDEFIILFPETNYEWAAVALEAVRRGLASRPGSLPAATCSIGALTFETVPNSVDEMLRLVDEVLYEAKRGEKDRLVRRVAGERDRA